MIKRESYSIVCKGKSRKDDWMKVRGGVYDHIYFDKNYLYSKHLLTELVSRNRSEGVIFIKEDGSYEPVGNEFLKHWISQLKDDE